MSSSKVCSHCGCTEIDKDPARGDAVCTNCGSVLEEQNIVSEIQFEENAGGGSSVIGQFVSNDGTKSHTLGISFPHGTKKESRTVTYENGYRKIQQLGAQLKLNQHCIETAFNFFKMAVNKHLTTGRKSSHVIAACLYLVCRTEGTPHMLLDFSDVLQVNVYTLGKTYLILSRELCINIPALDPCLYIQRFAHRLEFGEKTHEVSLMAMRLVQRMKRDWMHTGRRPSGLCGAALLVAARMFEFNRTLKDIIKVVKIGDSTIRKRLNEFQATPSGQLTIEEFQNIDLEEEQDPPSFTEGKRRAQQEKLAKLEEKSKMQELTSEVTEIQNEIEKNLVPAKPRGIWAAYAKCSSSPEKKEIRTENTITNTVEYLNQEALKDCISENDKGGDSVCKSNGTSDCLGLKDTVEKCAEEDITSQESKNGCVEYPRKDSTETGQLDLSGINDEELDQFLLTKEEIAVKTEMWMKDNADYLAEQKKKEERLAKEKELEAQNPEKKKRKKQKRREPIVASSGREAIAMLKQEKKISTKINYDVLNDLKGQGSKKTNQRLPPPMLGNSEDSPAVNFLKRLRTSSISSQEEPRTKNPKQILSDTVIVESGPVHFETEAKQEPDVDEVEDEEYEEEEDALVSASQLLGQRQIDHEYDYQEIYEDD